MSGPLHILLISWFLIVVVHCRTQATDSPVIQSSGIDLSQEYRSFVIESWKAKILKYLRRKEPLNLNYDNGSPRLSREVIEVLQEERDISEDMQKENLIIHASNSNFSCLSKENCSRFEFTMAEDIKSIISVQIWFHKSEPQENITVTVFSSAFPSADTIIRVKEHHSVIRMDSGWIAFELPKLLAFESRPGELYCTLEVENSPVDEEGDLSPFLVISKTIYMPERKRRSFNSNENCYNCCAENFYVTLEEIGWKSWVISPTVFDIKTCKGQCVETHSSYKRHYQRIRNALNKLNNTLYPKPICSFWVPKCQPTRYLPLRLMYDNNGTVHDQLIQDMIVESCECK